ncbi:MAG: hypothetical protein C0498_08820 [Anaerolinea sp.]|jgi:hypothetical protein|nr:hypothetical protein [Anaerolinea sp.]
MAAEGHETLAVSVRVALNPEDAWRALASPDWLGAASDPAPDYTPEPRFRRFLSDLAFPVTGSARTLVFRKAALVDLGPIQRLPDGSAALEITWRSATFAPLFPVFSGRLLVRTDGLFLEGAYAPPFGELGRLVDRAVLHQVAVRTARWFVSQVAARLTPADLKPPIGS